MARPSMIKIIEMIKQLNASYPPEESFDSKKKQMIIMIKIATEINARIYQILEKGTSDNFSKWVFHYKQQAQFIYFSMLSTGIWLGHPKSSIFYFLNPMPYWLVIKMILLGLLIGQTTFFSLIFFVRLICLCLSRADCGCNDLRKMTGILKFIIDFRSFMNCTNKNIEKQGLQYNIHIIYTRICLFRRSAESAENSGHNQDQQQMLGEIIYKIDSFLKFLLFISSIIRISQPGQTLQCMAHLIQTSDKFQPKCILSIPCKQIITPKYRHLLRDSAVHQRQLDFQHKKEQIALQQLCEKLTEKQLQKLQAENQRNLKKQFQKIKSKLRSSVHKSDNESQVIKYFQGRDKSENLSSLLKNNRENVEIGVKYNRKILNRIFNIREVSNILDSKEKYVSWLDSSNNSPLKSPNYVKMNYVLERISLKKDEKGGIPVISFKNLEKEQSEWTEFVRKTDIKSLNSTFYSRERKTDYSPKTKCPHFLKRLN